MAKNPCLQIVALLEPPTDGTALNLLVLLILKTRLHHTLFSYGEKWPDENYLLQLSLKIELSFLPGLDLQQKL